MYKTVAAYCDSRIQATVDFPFGPEVAAYRIRSKIFALLMIGEGHAKINLKCEPLQAQALRDIFPGVTPGYHMNKKHWNTVLLDGSVPASEVERMIDHSYDLVVKGLPKTKRPAGYRN